MLLLNPLKIKVCTLIKCWLFDLKSSVVVYRCKITTKNMCYCPKTYGPDCSLFHKPEHDNPRIVWEVLFNKKPPQKTRYSLDIIFWHKLPVHRKCSSPLPQHIAIKLIETHCAVLACLFSVQWLSGASVPYLWLIFAGVWIQASKWWCKLCSLERKKERKEQKANTWTSLYTQ